MQCNVGGADRVLRLVVGLALVGYAWFQEPEGWMLWAAWVVGAIALLSALAGF